MSAEPPSTAWSHPVYTLAELKSHKLELIPDEVYPDKVRCLSCQAQTFEWTDPSDYPPDLRILPWLHSEDCQSHALNLSNRQLLRQIYETSVAHGSQIRVVRLHGRRASSNIHCTLETVQRATSPAYNALSYVWGSTEGLRPYFVLLNDTIWRVTPNLFHALLTIRRESNDVYVWVDALCINQLDPEEKSQQVRLMAEIYKASEETQIWLNNISEKEPPYVQRAGDTLVSSAFESDDRDILATIRFAQDYIRFEDDDTDKDERPSPDQLRDEHYVGALCLMSQLSMDMHLDELLFYQTHDDTLSPCSMWPFVSVALEVIGQSIWFTRIWTLQEAALSSENLVHFRGLRFRSTMVTNAYRNAEKHQKSCCSARYAAASSKTEDMMTSLALTNVGFELPEIAIADDSHSLGDLMYSTTRHRATDPRDKVYGLLGLLSETEKERVGDRLPDYKLNVQQVYTLTAQYLVSENFAWDSSLCLMFVRRQNCQRLGLPSWVCDWSDADDTFFGRTNIRDFQASLGTSPKRDFHLRYLALGNFGVDCISELGDVIDDWDDCKQARHRIRVLDGWLALAHRKQTKDHSTEHLSKRPRVEDPQVSVDDSSVKPFWDALRSNLGPRMIASTDSALDAVVELVRWGRDHPDSFNPRAVPNHLKQAYGVLCDFLWRRRFFITQLGLLGFGPVETEIGDEVRIFLGSPIPFVVRPLKPFFRWNYELNQGVIGQAEGMHLCHKGDACREVGDLRIDESKKDSDDRSNSNMDVHAQSTYNGHVNVSESTQGHLDPLSRSRLQHRKIANQVIPQVYAEFVAAAVADWVTPPPTEEDAQEITSMAQQVKIMTLARLGLRTAEIAQIIEEIFTKVERYPAVAQTIAEILTSAGGCADDTELAQMSERFFAEVKSRQIQPEGGNIKADNAMADLLDDTYAALNQTHILIGDCYVHGIMQGEMMEGLDEATLEDDILSIDVTSYDRILLG